ncbi:MAG: SUMF1/EgtB/PvdO family nonheme iron enzyme [Fusobacteriaceae bacterium]
MRFLVNDPTRIDPRAKLTTSVLASFVQGVQATKKQYIESFGDAAVKINTNTLICVGESIFKTERDITLNTGNLDAGAFQDGKDYYIYCCDKGEKLDEEYKISLNSTFPVGYTATNSRKIGGFHYGVCRREINKEPINSSGVAWGTGWQDNVYDGIMQYSVWTLLHRPVSNPEGMVYVSSNLWVDIYISSDAENGAFRSAKGVVPVTGSEGLCGYDFTERMRKTDKRLLTHNEWVAMANGSPNGLDGSNDYAWSATTNTSRKECGFVRKAVSVYGVKDCAGNVWEWLQDIVIRPADVPVGFGWKNETENKKGGVHSYYTNGIAQLLAGASWGSGVRCGSRAVDSGAVPWIVFSINGARGCSDSL